MRVGLIGIGTMGRLTLSTLVEADYSVVAFDKFPAAVQYARNLAAVIADSPQSVAEQ